MWALCFLLVRRQKSVDILIGIATALVKCMLNMLTQSS